MHTHGNRERAIAASRVSGLGICDALRLTLEPVQIPWLDDELDEITRTLEEARAVRAVASVGGRREDVDAESSLEYRLHLLRLIHAQVRDRHGSDSVVVVGPSVMVSELIRSTMRHTIDTLAELASGPELQKVQTQIALCEAAAAAAAWVATFRDVQAVEGFNLDPEVDPLERY